MSRKGLQVRKQRVAVTLGDKTWFKDIKAIKYEGPESDNPLAFRYYNENKVIGKKTMKEHLRFAVAYWHSLCGTGQDMFGGPTIEREWNNATDPMQR